MNRFILLLALVIILCGCAKPTPELSEAQRMAGELASTLVAQLPTRTPQPTYTPFPTYTALPTYTAVVVTQIIVVTATSSPTPLYTPTETLPPTETSVPSATLDPLQTRKRAGIYLVGIDIAPGVWRNNGTGDECYWARYDRTGEIIDNHYGLAGGTIYIAPTDFSVEFDEKCGTWEYLGPP